MRCLPLADDCGLSTGITEGILRCLDAGGLRGASVLAGGEHAREACTALAARQKYGLGPRIGVHLNILEGRATARPAALPILADCQGRFKLSAPALWAGLTLASRRARNALIAQIELEFHTQAEFILKSVSEGSARGASAHALPALYLDGHLHVHALPALRPVLGTLLETFSFKHVRVPLEPLYLPPVPPVACITGVLRRGVLALWAKPLRAFLQKRGASVPDFFLGAFCSCSMTLPRLASGLKAIRKLAPAEDALVEIMLHPGGLSESECRSCASGEAVYSAAHASPCRKAEAEMLLSQDFHRLMAHYDKTWPDPLPNGHNLAEAPANGQAAGDARL